MLTEVQFVFLIIAAAAVLFASGRVRFDVVAGTVILVLVISGVLTPDEAFAGFGSPVVVLLAGLLIVAEMLTSTGAAYAFGHWFSRIFGGSERRLLAVLMVSATIMGSIMSATLVVAVLLPAMLRVANRTGVAVSRLLLPLSFAALISGMMTLVGAPPNMIVAAELEAAGVKPLTFFSFAPVGLAVLGLAIVYMLLLGRRALPQGDSARPGPRGPGARQLMEEFGIRGRGRLFRVPSLAPVVGLRIRDSLLARAPFDLLLVQRARKLGGQTIAVPDEETLIKPGDQLLAFPRDLAQLETFVPAAQLQHRNITPGDEQLWTREVGVAKLLLHPQSRYVGKSLRDIPFGERYHILPIGLRRQGEQLEDYHGARLQSGDSLLAVGSWRSIARLQATSRNFVVLATAQELENHVPRHRKAPVAFAIVVAMVLLLALDQIPMVITVCLAIGAGVFTGCLTMDDAYNSIPWSNIVQIAGMLPVALALDKTGGVDAIVEALVAGVGAYGPHAMIVALFVVTALLGFLLSNAATAILMAPIALSTAEKLAVDPHVFAMTVAIAATASFITPYSTPVVSLVVEPGGYRYSHFLKVGLPLLLMTLAITLLVLPRLYPF